MVKRIINTSIRSTSLQSGGMTLMLSDTAGPADAELAIRIEFRGTLDQSRPAVINQAIVLALARNAIIAQIQAISRDHGPIPEEHQ